MTLLPVEQARITVPPQDAWTFEGFPAICQAPGCRQQRMAGTHHIVRRSHTGGACRWIAIDGLVVLNECVLCYACHAAVTDHHAWVRYDDHGGWDWFVACPTGTIITGRAEDWAVQPKSGRIFRRNGALKEARWNPATGQVETAR